MTPGLKREGGWRPGISSEFVTGPPNQGTATLHQVNHVRRIQMPAWPRAALLPPSTPPKTFQFLLCHGLVTLRPGPASAPGPPHHYHTLFGRRLNLGDGVSVACTLLSRRNACKPPCTCGRHVRTPLPSAYPQPFPPVHVPRGVETDIMTAPWNIIIFSGRVTR